MASIQKFKTGTSLKLFLALLLSVSFLFHSSSASADTAKYRISAQRIGAWDAIYVDWRPPTTSATMIIQIKQQGVHTGQKANVRWKLIRTSTGATVASFRISNDYNGGISISNIQRGDYQLVWESLTSNAIEGEYGVPSDWADTYQ